MQANRIDKLTQEMLTTFSQQYKTDKERFEAATEMCSMLRAYMEHTGTWNEFIKNAMQATQMD